MAFGQLTNRNSLRDIVACLSANRNKLHHMGIRGGVSLNNLSNANMNRDWRIYAEFAQVLINTALFPKFISYILLPLVNMWCHYVWSQP
jgi:hypothetical protein